MLTKQHWPAGFDSPNRLETALGLRRFLLVLELPLIFREDGTPLLHVLLYKMLNISPDALLLFQKWIEVYPPQRFQRLVRCFQDNVTQLVRFYTLDYRYKENGTTLPSGESAICSTSCTKLTRG